MANQLAIALTESGVASARKAHPENTKRKAVQLKVRDTKTTTYAIKALGGAELTIDQVLAQFRAHWKLGRMQGKKYANSYSSKIVAETRAILKKEGVQMAMS